MCGRCRGLGGVIAVTLIGGFAVGYITGQRKAQIDCVRSLVNGIVGIINDCEKKTES